MRNALIVLLLLCGPLMAQEAPATLHAEPSTYVGVIGGNDFLTHTSALIVLNAHNCEMVRVAMDGKLTFGKCYQPDKAAETFWTAIANKSPYALEKRIAELEAELAKLKKAKAH